MAYVELWTPVALRITRVDAPIDALAPELEEYTIAVLSDLHYGGTVAPSRLIARAVHLANEASPDLALALRIDAPSDDGDAARPSRARI